MATPLIIETHELCWHHDAGPGHPERPSRLDAARRGWSAPALDGAVTVLDAPAADVSTLGRVHGQAALDAIEATVAAGGGRLDADTTTSPGSWAAAMRAVGAGLDARRRLVAGEAEAAFCAVRPPGHHARPDAAMGFCLVNSIAVLAAELVAAGEKVAIIDWDAHHGNGTQEIFWDEPDVLFASIHQWPLYPGTGAATETGGPAAAGKTINVAVPPGATGDVACAALDDVIGPAVEAHGADWVLVSAGFDGHRADPLTSLGYDAGDFAALAARCVAMAPRGRTVLMMEGGYDLAAIEASVAAALVAVAAGQPAPPPATTGGPGREAVAATADALARLV